MHEKQECFDDNLFEAMFGQAIKEIFESSLNDLSSEKEISETYSLSQFHEARMKKLFVKNKQQERIQAIIKRSKQVAAVIAFVTTILFGSLLFTKDVRADVLKTITH